MLRIEPEIHLAKEVCTYPLEIPALKRTDLVRTSNFQIKFLLILDNLLRLAFITLVTKTE